VNSSPERRPARRAQGIAFALNADTVQEALSRHLSSLRMAGVRSVFTCHETVLTDPGSRQHVVIDSVAVPPTSYCSPEMSFYNWREDRLPTGLMSSGHCDIKPASRST